MREIQETLGLWYEANKRDLPWRSDPSPYHVWLSEIILQQTRVSQGLDYYLRFVERWPSLSDLAKADEEEVLKMWQGLGYYSRARNLHQCARQVMERHQGSFPEDYESLRQLKGVGGYTAAAIASIAFNKPHAVVDGNVYRVLSRLYDIDTPINKSEGVRVFAELADTLLDRERPGLHNQAMMEFGALQCVPQNPDCLHCPLQAHCLAFDHHSVAERPVKEKNLKVKTRYFHYLVLHTDDHRVALRKRQKNDIWENLYDFPCVESDHPLTVEELIDSDQFVKIVGKQELQISRISPAYTHKLTHQTLIASFIEIKNISFLPSIQTNQLLLVPENDLDTYPVPKLIENYLTSNKR